MSTTRRPRPAAPSPHPLPRFDRLAVTLALGALGAAGCHKPPLCIETDTSRDASWWARYVACDSPPPVATTGGAVAISTPVPPPPPPPSAPTPSESPADGEPARVGPVPPAPPSGTAPPSARPHRVSPPRPSGTPHFEGQAVPVGPVPPAPGPATNPNDPRFASGQMASTGARPPAR